VIGEAGYDSDFGLVALPCMSALTTRVEYIDRLMVMVAVVFLSI